MKNFHYPADARACPAKYTFTLLHFALGAVLIALCSFTSALANPDAGIRAASPMLIAVAQDPDVVSGTGCQPLVLPASVTLAGSGADFWVYPLSEGQLGGGPLPDSAQLEFYSTSMSGTFSLSTGGNANYATCTECILLFEDIENGESNKIYFQDQGTLTIANPPGSSPLVVGFSGLRLVEVTIDNNFHSTPVPGGSCYVGVSDRIFSSGFDS